MKNSKAISTSSLLSVADVARILGIKLRSAYRWVHKYPALGMQRIGRRIYVDNPDLETFMARHEAAAAPRQPESQDKVPDLAAPPTGAAVTTPGLVRSPDLERCPNGGSGQRELCIPRATNYPLVVFTDFEFVG